MRPTYHASATRVHSYRLQRSTDREQTDQLFGEISASQFMRILRTNATHVQVTGLHSMYQVQVKKVDPVEVLPVTSQVPGTVLYV